MKECDFVKFISKYRMTFLHMSGLLHAWNFCPLILKKELAVALARRIIKMSENSSPPKATAWTIAMEEPKASRRPILSRDRSQTPPASNKALDEKLENAKLRRIRMLAERKKDMQSLNLRATMVSSDKNQLIFK